MEDLTRLLPNDYLVIIRCLTFNHAQFINESLNGFASQDTDFHYLCVIMDDCSTDGAQEVMKEWIKSECDQATIQIFDLELTKVILARHKTNINCLFAFYLLKQNLYCDSRKEDLFEQWVPTAKYIAFCEGDDYWIEKNKLQEQVAFLEAHNVYSATSSNSIVLQSESTPTKPFATNPTKDFYKIQDIVVSRQFHTASVLYRISSMQGCPYSDMGDWDTFKWCSLLTQGPIHYDEKVTCVYRQQNQGVTETTPTVKWLETTSRWADIIIDCFVPKYVQRKYVVRSVSKGIIRTYLINYNRIRPDDRKILLALFRHNFAFGNFFYDMKEFVISCAKIICRRKERIV